MALRAIFCSLLMATQLLLPLQGMGQETTGATPAAEDTTATNATEKIFLGYSAESSGAENVVEAKYRGEIITDNIRENMRRLSARPHHVGSPYDKDNAEWILA
ncbi:MAG: hypothetical protein WBE88_12100, partial [Candidatus Acidiferrales bacterium]